MEDFPQARHRQAAKEGGHLGDGLSSPKHERDEGVKLARMRSAFWIANIDGRTKRTEETRRKRRRRACARATDLRERHFATFRASAHRSNRSTLPFSSRYTEKSTPSAFHPPYSPSSSSFLASSQFRASDFSLLYNLQFLSLLLHFSQNSAFTSRAALERSSFYPALKERR